jgi:hypothetical protein
MDLPVAQNGAETRLYRNTAAPPGLRVKLLGEDTNPQAFGAVIRQVLSGRVRTPSHPPRDSIMRAKNALA